MTPNTQADPTQTKTHTLRLTRIMKAPQERVYKAFLDADALVKWLPPNGYTAHMHSHEAKVDGTWRMSFTNLDSGQSMSFGGKFLELTPYSRIRYTDVFDDPALQTGKDIIVTVTLKPVPGGTEVNVVQENIPSIIPLEDSEKGWGQSFDNLQRLVELGDMPSGGSAGAPTAITVEALVKADAKKAWDAWNNAADIKQWNTPSPDWHTKSSNVDLRVGGRLTSRMEAKDGSAGFDFAATYTKIEPQRLVEFRLDDDRMVRVEFLPRPEGVLVRETFDAESENDPEFQRQGWQAILDSFARHVEAKR